MPLGQTLLGPASTKRHHEQSSASPQHSVRGTWCFARSLKRLLYIYASVGLCALLTISGCTSPKPTVIDAMPPATATMEPSSLSPLPALPYTLAFASGGELYTISADGGDRQPLLRTVAYENSLAWSPSGDYLAVSSTVDRNQDIVIMPIGPEGRPLAEYNLTQSPLEEEITPAWSPDGHRLAYGLYDTVSWRIRVADLDLFDPQQAPVVSQIRTASYITQALRYKGHPAWSPDGEWLAYTSDANSHWQIMRVQPFGDQHEPFPGTEAFLTGTGYPANAAYPAWSPDGTQLAFATARAGGWGIYLVAADGSHPRRLTDHPAADWHPAWSPDGAWIAFISERSGNGDLYLIRADGTNLAQLTDTPEPEDSPCWRPPTSADNWLIFEP